MQIIEGYEPGGGNAKADDALEKVRSRFGMIPNFHKVLALSPAAVEGFVALHGALSATSLSPLEREIVALEVSRRNDCHYCSAAHAALVRRMGLAEGDLSALLAGRPLSDARHRAVQHATQQILDSLGHLGSRAAAALLEDGLSVSELIEITAVVGQFTFATLVNNLAQTEIDAAFRAATAEV